MDNKSQITVVSVHSSLKQYSSTGSYYTSYAISLKSNNPCFTRSYSQSRRRYSEFLHLRYLLMAHHPNVKPPALPPKSYFHRFSDALIEERKVGLQKFLEQVLAVPVYLSDKSLHLFLQSSCSMSQIDEECVGDIPVPQLMDDKPSNISYHSDTSSNSSSDTLEKKPTNRTVETLRINSFKYEVVESTESDSSSSSDLDQSILPAIRKFRSRPLSIPRHQGSLDSSPSSSVSSLDTSYCSSLEFNRTRRVSFNEKVTVAIVCNQLWNIGVKPIRTE